MTLEQALSVANQLAEIDKLRLIQRLMMDMKLTNLVQSEQPLISSFGILAKLGTAPSEAEIDQVRQEMCAIAKFKPQIYKQFGKDIRTYII